jgi:hypothetical protein
MDDTNKVAADSASAEHAHAQAVATEAAEKARAAQLREIMEESDQRMTRMLTAALKETFGPEDKGTYANIVRIPLICQDLKTLRGDVSDIKDNIKWAVRVVIGAVILALLALVLR